MLIEKLELNSQWNSIKTKKFLCTFVSRFPNDSHLDKNILNNLRYCAWVREDSVQFFFIQDAKMNSLDRTFSINEKKKNSTSTIVAAAMTTTTMSRRLTKKKRFI